ncbi:MAG: hypothetical protein LBR34_11230, partial [Prevotella sp.]|nr:hypothetical protein [Prevotella sp.]
TEKLSPIAPMVLHSCGRVGSCRIRNSFPCRKTAEAVCVLFIAAGNGYRLACGYENKAGRAIGKIYDNHFSFSSH